MIRSLLPYCVVSVAVHAGVLAAIGMNASQPQPHALRGSELSLIEFVVSESVSEQPATSASPVATEPSSVERPAPVNMTDNASGPVASFAPSQYTERETPQPEIETVAEPASIPVAREAIPATVQTAQMERPTNRETRAAAEPLHPSATSASTPGDMVDAQVSRLVRPVYPRSARKNGYEGEVLLEAVVARDGDVQDVSVVVGSGYADLDASALKALRKSRFAPGTRAGLPIESATRVLIRFELEED